jgi:DNA-binding transcriptional LysR family regulator
MCDGDSRSGIRAGCEAHGGIGRAAEALDMTQPALTKAVQRVEAQLGVPLFERTTLGMRVTQAGRSFWNGRRIRLEYEDAIKEMRGIQTGEQGMLRLGYSLRCPMRWCWARAGN